MREQVDSIERDVKAIKEALIGGEYNKKGIVHRLEEVENYQNKDKKQKWVLLGGATVIGSLLKFWDKIF